MSLDERVQVWPADGAGQPPALERPRIAPSVENTERSGSCLSPYLRRCAEAGARLVVSAPADAVTFGATLAIFSTRSVDASAHRAWDRAYRDFRAEDYRSRGVAFDGGKEYAHDPGSWRVLAADQAGRVVGALTARVFPGTVRRDYLYDFALVRECPQPSRGAFEAALNGLIEQAESRRLAFGELSNWAVATDWQRSAVGVTLVLAMGALMQAFPPHVCVAVANHDTGALGLLRKLGLQPLRDNSGAAMSPFFHPGYGAHLGFLAGTTADFHERYRPTAADLAVLLEASAVISLA